MHEHTATQLMEKRLAIDTAIVMFFENYRTGRLTDIDLLLHEIENLNQLVLEYKRG